MCLGVHALGGRSPAGAGAGRHAAGCAAVPDGGRGVTRCGPKGGRGDQGPAWVEGEVGHRWWEGGGPASLRGTSCLG